MTQDNTTEILPWRDKYGQDISNGADPQRAIERLMGEMRERVEKLKYNKNPERGLSAFEISFDLAVDNILKEI